MKHGTLAFVLLFLGLMARGVAADDIQMNGNVGVSGSVAATSFSGNGLGLTNLDPTKITPGTANINISGNAASATMASTANSVSALSVTNAGLANDSVTPAKIAFYGKVAIVATSGGDYSNPATAMSSYATWCGTPLPTNPCLLKIMPGVYNVGISPVVMQPYIDIEGSGEKTTKITGSIISTYPPSAGTVEGANNAELRFLTVENTGTSSDEITAIVNTFASPSIIHVTATTSGGNNSHGIYNNSSSPTMSNVTVKCMGANWNFGIYNYSSSPTMSNVTATVSGATYGSIGVYNNFSSTTMTNVTATASGGGWTDGIFNYSSSPSMTNVIATASGTTTNHGVGNNMSSPTMINVTATASGSTDSYGLYNLSSSGTVKINHSVIKGFVAIYNGLGVTTLVGNSQLDGGATVNNGTLICAGVYDENYTFYANTCP